MAGNREGGMLTKQKLLNKNPNYYKDMGRLGGQVKGTKGGFAQKKICNCEAFPYVHTVPMCAGKKGGTVSRRKPPIKPAERYDD